MTAQAVADGTHSIQTDTLYIRKKASPTTVDAVQAPPNQTSETSSRPTLSENIIQNTNGVVNVNQDFRMNPEQTVMVNGADGTRTQSVGAAAAGFDPYSNQLQQFGAIPEGENPARPIDVPKRTAKDNKVSWTARTILEAAATPDSAVGDIGQAVVDGKFSYVPVTNKQTAADAETTIKRLGYQGVLSQFKTDVQNGVASEKVTALGLTLYNNAVNSGDTKLALDIAYDLAQSVRNGARATQAMRILKQLTPGGRLYMLQREVSKINEQQGFGPLAQSAALLCGAQAMPALKIAYLFQRQHPAIAVVPGCSSLAATF